MSLYIPTFEERVKIEQERNNIINAITHINDMKSLHHLSIVARQHELDELERQPLRLDDFVNMLDLPMQIRLMELFKDESSKYVANNQIKELLAIGIDTYTGAIEDESA